MRILVLSQVFWPDTASTSQHLTDLAEVLSSSHNVQVVSSRNNYENPHIRYRKHEAKGNISITRLGNTAFGKRSTLSRLVDFLTFNLLLSFKLAKIRRSEIDLIIGLTSPPMVSFVGSLFAKFKRIPFVYWTMDLQPEISIASGFMAEKSLTSRMLLKMGNYTFRNARKIIALDRFMADYAIKRGAHPAHVHIVPVWPAVEGVFDGARNENPFRQKYGFGDKIVVMYSGNHSHIHPLDTILNASLKLRNDPRFLFVFVGGGIRKKDVSEFRSIHSLASIVQLEYQPRSEIHISLASSDIQVVVLGDGQVGYTHPNKIYGALFIGRPVLYIGPENSHISDILNFAPGNISVRHGEIETLVNCLLAFADKSEHERNEIGTKNKRIAVSNFHPDMLKGKMVDIINSASN